MIALGLVFRIILVISSNLGKSLKIKSIYIIIDFCTVGFCICIAGFAMIFMAERVAFYLCLATIIGFWIGELCLDKIKHIIKTKKTATV
ncbi:MAG: hypothetical protein FWF58_04595 [Firmicutes bacterium]|nr:hypothetical protein [Bacillota bacterium]